MPTTTQKSARPLAWLLLAFVTIGLTVLIFLFKKKQKGAAAISKVIGNSTYAPLVPYLIAQAKHETANFTSNVYNKNNNLFGMNVPSKRPFDGMKGTGTPEGGTYALYKDDEQSAKDMINWLVYTNFPTRVENAEHFVNALVARSYFTDDPKNYLTALRKWLA